MAFPNVLGALKTGSPLSSYKLLLMLGMFSRPRYSPVFRKLLQPFVEDGQVAVKYRCFGEIYQIYLRESDLDSDLLSCRELGLADIYDIAAEFEPDLVIDGGGNIGLFSLRAVALGTARGKGAPRVVICEPLPRNVEQIEKHMQLNGVRARIMPVCLGGTRRSVPFYCREAIRSSFDPTEPYTSVMEIPVCTLEDAIGDSPAERILIKLDIEGMEMETLASFVPVEERAVYLVGELHDYDRNRSRMEVLLKEHGWPVEFYQIADNACLFHACSPAAAPMMRWTMELDKAA